MERSLRATLARAAAVAAAVAWAVSLVLPAFTAGLRNEVWYGGPVLGYGLFFGWLCNGWAVYANVCFLLALAQLCARKTPIGPVILMLAIAATLPAFHAVPLGESGATLPINAWGSGVAVWLASLVLLALAVFLRPLPSGNLGVALTASTDALTSALLDFKSGAQHAHTCPACHSVIAVSRDDQDPSKVKAACDCGRCSGTFTFEVPA